MVNMNETQLGTIEQIDAFLAGSGPVEFTPARKSNERFAFISRTLSQFDYPPALCPADQCVLPGDVQPLAQSAPPLPACDPGRQRQGKVVKRYRPKDVKTPLECLAQLHQAGLVTFRPGVSLAALQAQARAQSDLAATQAMQAAKQTLFDSFVRRRQN